MSDLIAPLEVRVQVKDTKCASSLRLVYVCRAVVSPAAAPRQPGQPRIQAGRGTAGPMRVLHCLAVLAFSAT